MSIVLKATSPPSSSLSIDHCLRIPAGCLFNGKPFFSILDMGSRGGPPARTRTLKWVRAEARPDPPRQPNPSSYTAQKRGSWVQKGAFPDRNRKTDDNQDGDGEEVYARSFNGRRSERSPSQVRSSYGEPRERRGGYDSLEKPSLGGGSSSSSSSRGGADRRLGGPSLERGYERRRSGSSSERGYERRDSPSFDKGYDRRGSGSSERGSDRRVSPSFDRGYGRKDGGSFGQGYGRSDSGSSYTGPDRRVGPSFDKGSERRGSGPSERGSDRRVSPSFDKGYGRGDSGSSSYTGSDRRVSPSFDKGSERRGSGSSERGSDRRVNGSFDKGPDRRASGSFQSGYDRRVNGSSQSGYERRVNGPSQSGYERRVNGPSQSGYERRVNGSFQNGYDRRVNGPSNRGSDRRASGSLVSGEENSENSSIEPLNNKDADGASSNSNGNFRSGDEDRRSPSGRIKKENLSGVQVQFSSAMDAEPHVAIIGGGMSGLMCALTLEERGIRSTVFDTGKHGLGGRMATRHIAQHNASPLIFDHAAQFFTVKDPLFECYVHRWISEGAVTEWPGAVGMLQEGGDFVELDTFPRYIAKNGMRHLADHMVSQVKRILVKRPCWISHMDANAGRWYLSENGRPQGEFDAVVIAHNGKCANRLLSTSGVPLIAKQMKKLDLSSVWALLAAFNEPLPQPKGYKGTAMVDGAFVEGISSLSWIGNNTRKLLPQNKQGPFCYTFLSTAVYGKKNKVPQESVPVVKAQRVTREMLQGVELALGLPEGSLPDPIYTKVQLWGAALPTNTPGVPCIFDPYGRVGICGDWLLGSSLEAAAVSGIAMANHIADYSAKGVSSPEDFSIGLNTSYSRVEGQDIGQFPGMETKMPEMVAA